MVNTQHLLQRFLCSGVVFFQSTLSMLNLQVVKHRVWMSGLKYSRMWAGAGILLTISKTQEWMSLWQNMFLPPPPFQFSLKLTPELVRRETGLAVCWLSDTPGLQSMKGQMEKCDGGLTNWAICWLPAAVRCCYFCLLRSTAEYCYFPHIFPMLSALSHNSLP